jgi:hypothetical protein
MAAQELFEIEGHEVDPTVSGDEDKCGIEIKRSDIWQDATSDGDTDSSKVIDLVETFPTVCRTLSTAK